MSDQLLEKVLKTVTEIRDAQREMRTQLLGTAEGAETENGRLPKLESAVAKHDARLDELEGKEIHRKGWISGAAAVGATVGATVGSIFAGLIGWIMHAFEVVKK